MARGGHTHTIIFAVRKIAAPDLPTVRDLATGVTRPATDDELLNFGLKRIGPDLFDCAEDYRSVVFTDENGNPVRAWHHVHDPVPTSDNGVRHAVNAAANRLGTLHSVGRAGERHRAVPDAIKPQVLRARVLAATDPTENAVTLATEAAHPSTDPDAILAAAQALAQPPAETTTATTLTTPTTDATTPAPVTAPIERQVIPMAEVDPTVHVVEASQLHPHSWHGERIVPPPPML